VVLDSTGKLLTDLDALDHVDPEVTPQRLRDQGLYRLVFEKLISMGRIEEAVAIIEEHLFTPVELVQSFSALAAAGQLDMAIGLARKRLDANLIFILPIGCWTPTARKEIGKPVLSYCSGECRPYLQCGTMPN
jgi:hypothetical protein